MNRRPVYSNHFKRDVRLAESRGKQLQKLWSLSALLLKGSELPVAYKDHPLKGEWRGFRDAHIEPDWILIYRVEDEAVYFERTGRHSDLFDE